jgi:hypothetical protein
MDDPLKGPWRSPQGWGEITVARSSRTEAGGHRERMIAMIKRGNARRARRGWGSRLTAEPDERVGSRHDRRSMREALVWRNDPEPGIRQRLGERGSLVVIASIETVDPLERRRGGTRLREPKSAGPDRFQPLEGGIARAMGRAELRSLGGRYENRPHGQDHEHSSKELGFHDFPDRIRSKGTSIY